MRGAIRRTARSRTVGRINFVLRTIVLVALAYSVELLAVDLLHLQFLPDYAYLVQRIAVFGIFGMFWLRPLDGRLVDAGLARWYRYPAITLWLVSTSLPVIFPHWPLLGLALFLLLLIPGGTIPGKLAWAELSVTCNLAHDQDNEEPESTLPTKKFPALPLVSRIDFVRSLLTLACLWLPLIRLEEISQNHIGAWIARFGYAVLCVVWLTKAIGRLEDIGKPPTVRQGLLVILLILSIGLLHRLGFTQASHRWQDDPFFHFLSNLVKRISQLNGYEKLGLFFAIQAPLMFLVSDSNPTAHSSSKSRAKRKERHSSKDANANDMALCGPFEYLRILLVIAGLFLPLIYIDYASDGGMGSWLARAGYAILAFFWLSFAHGRLKDAGWAHDEYPAQYFLVVSVASLMPLAVHWVNAYGAIAIFVILQIPTALLKTAPTSDERE